MNLEMFNGNQYVYIVFDEVKGYKDLADEEKDNFRKTYKTHNACLGMDTKADYIPVSVEAQQDYLRVEFANGSWLHYNNCEWW